MGLFSRLFGKSEPEAETPEAMVYMNRAYVNHLLIERLHSGNVALVTFFSSTHRTLLDLCKEEHLQSKIILFPAPVHASPGLQVIFAERHPLQQKETEAITQLRAAGINTPLTAYCGLDDSIMMKFGGERIVNLMKTMGMSETECIQHSMISSSIRNAQKKTLKKVAYEQQAKSPDEWYRLNLRGD